MLTDIRYAMGQVRLASECRTEGARRDCLQRAMDALERLQEAAQAAENAAELEDSDHVCDDDCRSWGCGRCREGDAEDGDGEDGCPYVWHNGQTYLLAAVGQGIASLHHVGGGHAKTVPVGEVKACQ